MLSLYAFFHLNIAYSSIEEEQRPQVIDRCYRPLLRLIRDLDIPIGLEASGYTLESINARDPECLHELCALVSKGRVEFVGSGYVQLIGPLVPAAVNAANQRLGNEVYKRLLGFQPQIALVNEQAYSAGMVGHYLDAGYRAIIMEWNNPARCHPEWESEWRYLPQYALAADGRQIPLIWNNSIFFQKFQRYAHGEMDLDEYCSFIYSHRDANARVFPLYGNDAEIFDFRPGRYHTEAALRGEGEWRRIEKLFAALGTVDGLEMITPSSALRLLDEPGAGNSLRLESAEEPIPVKKQEKYNASRWSVTGRDDLWANTACWRIYEALLCDPSAGDERWRELCYLWSSDFRTHITEDRWIEFRERLRICEELLSDGKKPARRLQEVNAVGTTGSVPNFRVARERHLLEVETPTVRLHLNCRRGLAIDALWFKDVSAKPLCGTLPHGYFDDISLGADFYSGHLVMETPARPRVTDLVPVTPHVAPLADDGVSVNATVTTQLGEIEKRISIVGGAVVLTTHLNWPELPLGSLRLASLTLNPLAFDRETLFYRTHNGGSRAETFLMGDTRVNHGEAASFLVSAKQVLGVTEGCLELGDSRHILRLTVDRTFSALVGLVTFRRVGATYFARCNFSANEMDETSRPKHLQEPLVCSITISAS